MPRLTASDLMDVTVTTLSPQTEIRVAMESLLTKKVSGAPVVDDRNHLIGILSERDCLKIVANTAFERSPEGKVCDYMTTDVVTLAPRSTVYDVVDRFLKRPFRLLPVVDEDKVFLGVVSRTNVVRAVVAMGDSPDLYGTPSSPPVEEEGAGVDSAMRRARGR